MPPGAGQATPGKIKDLVDHPAVERTVPDQEADPEDAVDRVQGGLDGNIVPDLTAGNACRQASRGQIPSRLPEPGSELLGHGGIAPSLGDHLANHAPGRRAEETHHRLHVRA
jgi:hypothetical protein